MTAYGGGGVCVKGISPPRPHLIRCFDKHQWVHHQGQRLRWDGESSINQSRTLGVEMCDGERCVHAREREVCMCVCVYVYM